MAKTSGQRLLIFLPLYRCDFGAERLVFFQPFQSSGGDNEHNSFEPKDNKEALRKGAVTDALPIPVACLQANHRMSKSEPSPKHSFKLSNVHRLSGRHLVNGIYSD